MKKTMRFLTLVLALAACWGALGGIALAQCAPDPSGPGGSCPSPAVPPAPYVDPGPCGIGDLMFVDDLTLVWGFPAACLGTPLFDVVRGDLECLRAGNSASVACEMPLPLYGCAGTASTATEQLSAVPALGEAYWYLVRVTGFSWNGPPGGGQVMDSNPFVGDVTGCP